MKEIIDKIIKFRDERDWKQFHKPENLAISISLEASELLEHFQWNNEFDKEGVNEELADVMIYCIMMTDVLNVDIKEIMEKKLEKNKEKYPVEKAKGRMVKYDKL